MNQLIIQDLAKCREAELRMSRGPNEARSGWQGGPLPRATASRRARLHGRALLGRWLVEAGRHLLATAE